MADPTFVNCTADTWVKVATSVTSGIIRRVYTGPEKYLQTYRDTGGTAPTLETEGTPVFTKGETSAAIIADAPIDVYIWASVKDGRVRVDLG